MLVLAVRVTVSLFCRTFVDVCAFSAVRATKVHCQCAVFAVVIVNLPGFQVAAVPAILPRCAAVLFAPRCHAAVVGFRVQRADLPATGTRQP